MEKALPIIQLVSTDDLEALLATCLREYKLPAFFLHTGSGSKQACKQQASLNNDSMSKQAAAIAVCLPDNISVISLGIGSIDKSNALLRAIALIDILAYIAVDIDRNKVISVLDAIAHLDIPSLGLIALSDNPHSLRTYWRHPAVFCMLGYGIGRDNPISLIPRLRKATQKGDHILFDCHPLQDLCDNIDILDRSARENALLNMAPLLERGMQLDACAFRSMITEDDSDAFCRIDKWLDIQKDTEIWCGSEKINLAAGDRIQLGCSYRYSLSHLIKLLRQYGFREILTLNDPDEIESTILAERISD